MSNDSIERRLRKDSGCRFEQGEEIVAWCRAWVSRDKPMHLLLAARHRDFALVTDRRFLLVSTGFFSRLPRRRVLADRLDEITATPVGSRPGRCLRIESSAHAALLVELGGSDRSLALADALLRGTSQATPMEPAPTAGPAEGA